MERPLLLRGEAGIPPHLPPLPRLKEASGPISLGPPVRKWGNGVTEERKGMGGKHRPLTPPFPPQSLLEALVLGG